MSRTKGDYFAGAVLFILMVITALVLHFAYAPRATVPDRHNCTETGVECS